MVRSMKKSVIMLTVLAWLLAACTGGGTEPAVCDAERCPQGCCKGDVCIEPVDTACGTAGVACVDCTATVATDSCSEGMCVCAAEGEACPAGVECTAGGCVGCVADCAGKCAGAGDGCGGSCQQTDCEDGCCDSDNLCVVLAEQGDAQCGISGQACVDCTLAVETDTCDAGACSCAAEGRACDTGVECGDDGCGCQADCAGKCEGAPDGCGSFCDTTDCLMGCCLPDRTCLDHTGLDDENCGPLGQDCVDCTAQDRVCAAFTCVEDTGNYAEFIEQSVPAQMDAGQQVEVSVSMRNMGTAAWTAAAGYKLGAQNPQDNSTWGFNRVPLEDGETIGPGETKTFAFRVTAPAADGVYDFQWRMLQESVEWFGEFSPNVEVAVSGQDVIVCEAVRALAGTDSDASGVIQTCIDNTPSGGVLAIPAGVYRMDSQVRIDARAMTLKTEGKNAAMAKCDLQDHDCAELRASTAFSDTLGILQVLHAGVHVEHIVLNGNKTARAATPSGSQCASYNNSYGYNMRMVCDDCSLTNSVTKNALCGTGCEVAGTPSGVELWRNTVAYNGVHDTEGMWADGVTVHDAAGSVFTENEFIDNTDIDLIFGGCVDCVIEDNVIWHTEAFAGGSFAALMLHAWPDGNGGNGTSGNFTGTTTVNNSIDCSASRRCGIGLYLGSDAWYITDVYGGTVHDNQIDNAEMGLLIDDVHDMQVYDNPVTNPATFTNASCGYKFTYTYAIGNRSVNIDTAPDSLGTSYTEVDFDGCIPNWWDQ